MLVVVYMRLNLSTMFSGSCKNDLSVCTQEVSLAAGGRQAERCLYLLYLEAVSIRRAQPTPRLEKAVTQEAKRSQE